MNILDGISRIFGWNGHAKTEIESEPEVFDDEETKMVIELDADEAEELLRATAVEQKASVETFGHETINLREQFSEILKSEGKDDEHISATG